MDVSNDHSLVKEPTQSPPIAGQVFGRVPGIELRHVESNASAFAILAQELTQMGEGILPPFTHWLTPYKDPEGVLFSWRAPARCLSPAHGPPIRCGSSRRVQLGSK